MTIKRITWINIAIILLILIARWIFELHKFVFDPLSASLVFICIGISFIPFVSDINIFSILKIKHLDNEIREVKITIYKGKVVQLDDGTLEVFIDKNGIYHKFPDDETRDFFTTQEGVLEITKKELKQFTKGKILDSVLNSRIVLWEAGGGHIFIIMNNKKYHVSSASYLVDWERGNEQREIISTQEIQNFETGK